MLRCRADDQIAMYEGIGVRRNEQATSGVAAQFGDGPFDVGWVNYGSSALISRGLGGGTVSNERKKAV